MEQMNSRTGRYLRFTDSCEDLRSFLLSSFISSQPRLVVSFDAQMSSTDDTQAGYMRQHTLAAVLGFVQEVELEG